MSEYEKDTKDFNYEINLALSLSDGPSTVGVEDYHYNETVPVTGLADDVVSKFSKTMSRLSTAPSRVAEEQIESTGKSGPDSEAKDAGSIYSISNDARFDRFLPKTKILCVLIASSACFLSPLSGFAFLPAVPEIADRFNTSGEVINISAAVYCVFMSMSPCIFSPISDIYGRRPCFIVCCLMYCLCTILVAVSQNLAMFFIFRSLTALFATAFFSVGAHIIGDVYIPSMRGEKMAWVVSGAQMGTSLGGVCGGVIVNFTSWRVIFWMLAGCGGLILLAGIFFLPETLVVTKHQIILEEIQKTQPERKFVWVLFNPLRIITALKYPTLLLDGFIVIAMVYNMYSLLTPIRYVMDPRFNLTEPVYSGLFYLAPGLGYFIGSFIGGRWADHVVKIWIKKRGRRVPEDRLRQMVFSLTFLYPVCILIYGWSVEKEVGGMAVPVIFMFLSGFAQTTAFPASNAYCLDSVPELNGDAIASSYFSRYIAAAVASATCLRSIQSIGVGWTCTISAGVLLIASVFNFVLIFWGENMRMRSLVKYGHREQSEFDRILELQKTEPRF